MLLVSGHKSDKGLLRENNEDSIYVNDKVGVYVLADGMGGHEGGEMASNIAVNTIAKILYSTYAERQKKNFQQIVHKALQQANEEIILLRKRDINLANMGIHSFPTRRSSDLILRNQQHGGLDRKSVV